MTSSASCRRANFKTVTNEPSRKSFRVDSDRGVAALRLLGGHLRPEEHSPRAASRAAFAANAEAAPTIAGDTFQRFARFVRLSEISERRGDIFIRGAITRAQANNLA